MRLERFQRRGGEQRGQGAVGQRHIQRLHGAALAQKRRGGGAEVPHRVQRPPREAHAVGGEVGAQSRHALAHFLGHGLGMGAEDVAQAPRAKRPAPAPPALPAPRARACRRSPAPAAAQRPCPEAPWRGARHSSLRGEQQARRAEGPVQAVPSCHTSEVHERHAGDLVAVFQQDQRRRGVVFVLQQRAQLRAGRLVVARVGQAEEAAPPAPAPRPAPAPVRPWGQGPGRTAPSPARASAPRAVPRPDRAKAARRRAPDRCARRRSVPRRWAGRLSVGTLTQRARCRKRRALCFHRRGRRGAFPPRHRRSRPRPAPRARPGRALRRRRCRP